MALRRGGQSLFVSVYMCVSVYVHVSWTVAFWGRFQKSSASLMWFPLGHSNPSRPHPGTLVSGTVKAQCPQSVWMMQASPAIYRELFCKVKLWRCLSLPWVGALESRLWAVSRRPHPACLQSPHQTQIPMVGDSDTFLMRSRVRS